MCIGGFVGDCDEIWIVVIVGDVFVNLCNCFFYVYNVCWLCVLWVFVVVD